MRKMFEGRDAEIPEIHIGIEVLIYLIDDHTFYFAVKSKGKYDEDKDDGEQGEAGVFEELFQDVILVCKYNYSGPKTPKPAIAGFG